MHDGEPLRFKASFEVLPEIKVEGYKELRADKPEITVTDEEVEQALNRRARAARDLHRGRRPRRWPMAISPRSRSTASPKTDEGKPVHMDEVLVEIGGKNTMPEFTENLRGASAGDERTFEVKYPDDSQDKRLAGKTFTYTVKVSRIKQKTLPELNDEFAKELGEFADHRRSAQAHPRKHGSRAQAHRRARSQRQAGGGTGEAQ